MKGRKVHKAAKIFMYGVIGSFLFLSITLYAGFHWLNYMSPEWKILLPIAIIALGISLVCGIGGLVCVFIFGKKSSYSGRKQGAIAFFLSIVCVLLFVLIIGAMQVVGWEAHLQLTNI